MQSLYFLLAGMIVLKPGLVAILLFIGIRMLISEFYEIVIPTSIAVIFGILGSSNNAFICQNEVCFRKRRKKSTKRILMKIG